MRKTARESNVLLASVRHYLYVRFTTDVTIGPAVQSHEKERLALLMVASSKFIPHSLLNGSSR